MIDGTERRILDRLPTEARDRLRKMFDEHAGLMAGVRDDNDRRNQLRDEIAKEQSYIDRRMKAERLAADDSGIRGARETIKYRSQELGDLDVANNERHARLNHLSSITQRAIAAIGAVPASKLLQPAKPEPPNVRGSHADAVEKVRGRIRVMKGARDEIARAPLPVALLKEMARDQIEAMARRGQPDLTGLIAEGYAIEWPRSTQMAGGTPEDVLLSVLAYINPEAVIGAVQRQIDQEASDEGAMAPADRDAALKKLDAEIETAERAECALIDDARDRGVTIEHRDDVDPFALLALSREFLNAPEKPAQPYRTQDVSGQPRFPVAPQHASSLPEPALRDQVA